jgi:hypothetical protein
LNREARRAQGGAAGKLRVVMIECAQGGNDLRHIHGNARHRMAAQRRFGLDCIAVGCPVGKKLFLLL